MSNPFEHFLAPKNIAILLALLATTLYSIWLVQQTHHSKQHKPQNQSYPDAFLHNTIATHFDKLGKIHSQLISPSIVHYSIDNVALLEEPHFIVFHNEKRQPWHLTAKHGKSMHGQEQLILWDQVKLQQPAGAHNQDLTMDTSQLTIFPPKNYAQTGKPVTITQPDKVVNAIGMKVYFKEKRLQLLSQVRGVIDEGSKSH